MSSLKLFSGGDLSHNLAIKASRTIPVYAIGSKLYEQASVLVQGTNCMYWVKTKYQVRRPYILLPSCN
jgi:hypothetical protein